VVESVRTARELGWVTTGDKVVLVDAEIWALDCVNTKSNNVKIFTVQDSSTDLSSTPYSTPGQ
jgi:hypothetical protein